jgi:hypothetical protein
MPAPVAVSSMLFVVPILLEDETYAWNHHRITP